MPGAAAPSLEAVGVSKHYRMGPWALRDVSLRVEAGSRTALVGPNAAGKSTLIRLWVGFERPTGGAVSVMGIDPVRDPNGAIGHLAHVPQSPSLYRDLTVADHVTLAHQLRPGVDRAVARRRLDQLAIPLRARVSRLSGGQQAQVSLAIALGTRADVLVLDEPLASLDPLARREFISTLNADVAERGATVLLSSHSVADVERACDRIIVLGVGRVLVAESIAGLVASHALRPVGSVSSEGELVAEIETDDDEAVHLVRHRESPVIAAAGERPATLDEIVRAYLTAGRARVGEAEPAV